MYMMLTDIPTEVGTLVETVLHSVYGKRISKHETYFLSNLLEESTGILKTSLDLY